jgi:O-antigen ligase
VSAALSQQPEDDVPLFGAPGLQLRGAPENQSIGAVVTSHPALHRLNGLAGALVLLLLVLAPIPLGSNRPAFWMIWSSYVGLVAFIYGAALLWLRTGPRAGLAVLWPEVLLMLVLCAFVTAQLLPIARYLPDGSLYVPGASGPATSISLDPGSSRLVLIQFFTFGLLYLLAVQTAVNRRRARRMLLAIVVVVAAFAVFGLVSLTQLGDTLLGFEKQQYQGYATGTFVNRNSFATFLAVGLTSAAAYTMQVLVERRSHPVGRFLLMVAFALLCMAFMAATLLMTGSRLGTLAAAIGVLAVVLIGLFAYRGSGILVAAVTVSLLFAGVSIVLFFGASLVERLVLLPGVDESRVEVHRQIWEAIWARPWTGYGAGSFATVFQAFQRPPLSGEYVWENSHSTYLALWFEMGLVAGSIPLLIVAVVAVRSLAALRDPSSTALSLATLGVIIVFAVHSLLDFSAEIEANAFLLTVVMALGAAGAITGRAGRRQ